ncbi:sensitivity to high expression protein she9 [Fusarium piperis]|uniref:Sensitive to high expression protein 9, mitochondrial n=1 Tax=Fusarium piperis TaxID=1435070 RepID=A0A9W8T939_9HYPO|nr:sensitivity to high expression protein she9 [Fusarium piperis]
MQPFARPAARLAWGHARLGFDLSTRPGRSRSLFVQNPAICVRCGIQAIGLQPRLFSNQTPPDGPGKGSGSNSRTDKDVEAELRSILKPKPRPSPFKPQRRIEGPRAEQLRLGHPNFESPAEEEEKPHTLRVEAKTENEKPNETAQPQETRSRAETLRDLAYAQLSELKEKFANAMDRLQNRAMNASQTLNDITGYTGIEAIKHQNAVIETQLAEAHDRVRNARQAYKTSNTSRAATQREVTTLLARKDSWSPGDLERFTELYRADHVLEGEVVASQEALTEAEADEQSLSQRLNAGILKRYHEEQIWSDRIRRASTWGTWGLMGMNFVLFVVLQFVAEPWKRRRLIRGVVAEEKAALDEVRGEIQQVKLAIEKQDQVAAAEALAGAVKAAETAPTAEAAASGETATAEGFIPTRTTQTTEPVIPAVATPIEKPTAPPKTWEELLEELKDPEWWREKAEDLCSERRIDLRMRDASLLALEGALAGALLTASFMMLAR